MVLVVRGELRLTAGKAAVQVAHAAVLLALSARARERSTLARWEAEGQKKIAVVAESLAEMQGIERKARSLGVPTVFVEDAGLTEVPPGTRTVLGLGPARASEIDRLTGSLPLL
ncbi:MAG: peptidyl-tRNA hydrolase Pth2 [Thermoplasmata archaeon]|nr:peptidyl-tRNA hydrolase Pth2 [Thermoplasmata archaeon]MCI4359159.1 peptidyl-tRNA hydrolase Pth2 [Thermoplasmata archaeon]